MGISTCVVFGRLIRFWKKHSTMDDRTPKPEGFLRHDSDKIGLFFTEAINELDGEM